MGTNTYHVRTLERIGLIELVGESRVRGAVEHHYCSKERPSVSDEAWAPAPAIAKQAAVWPRYRRSIPGGAQPPDDPAWR